MVAVALDEADLVVLHRHFDTATTRTHITGGVLDFLRVVIFEFDLGVHAASRFKIIPAGFNEAAHVLAWLSILGDCLRQHQRISTDAAEGMSVY
jgi:hypothetical protein